MTTVMNDDTWSQVFLATIQSDPSALATIRSVNRAWFQAAGNMPQLWTKLVFNRAHHFSDPEYANLYFEHSGALPLEVSIDTPEGIESEEEIAVVQHIRKALPRIKSLSIRATVHEELSALILSIGGDQPAPILERLILSVQSGETLPDPKFGSLSTAFCPSPKLSHLELPSWPVPILPLPQLLTIKSLTFDSTPFFSIAVDELFPIIHSAPKLQDFAFIAADDFSYTTTADLNYPHVTLLPSLLTVDVTAPGAGADLLRNFDAPLLKRVRLDGWRKDHFQGRWEETLTEPVSVTIRRMSQRSLGIQYLELFFIKLHNRVDDYQYILSGEGFPSLEELVVTTSDIGDEALIASAGVTSMLKKLVLKTCKHVSGEGLRRFVQGRSSEFLLIIEGCQGVGKDDIDALSKIVRVETTVN